jgi:hypothetical protein
MISKLRPIIACALGLSTLAAPLAFADDGGGHGDGRHVLLISVDGVRP